MALVDGLLMDGLHYGTLALALWALVDALIRPANAYAAASKLNKPAWCAITALALVFAQLSSPLTLFWLAAAVGGDGLPRRRAPGRARPAAGRQQPLVMRGQ